jgi:hypothetical protein
MHSRTLLPPSLVLALLAGTAPLALAQSVLKKGSDPLRIPRGLTPFSTRSQTTPREEAARIEFFERRVRPVLVNNCCTCHSADTNTKGGLRVDDRNGLVHGGNRGPAVVPGRPDKSLLLQAVRQTHDKVKMPPNKRLSDREIADLTRWIEDGAAWPRVALPTSLGQHKARYARMRREHWAWQPLRQPKLPPVRDTSWARGDVDRYVLAGMEAKGLTPVADADRLTLLRRVTFDLTGLPPTPAEMEAFLADSSPEAFARVVDRLLASPAFGERWGRHWLDVARYAESTGPSRNMPYPHAWRYRDYVIDAFSHDKPYDQFLREQIAGDLLPAASQRQRDEQRIATGFLALGVHDVNQRFKVRFVMDNVDEQIDTVSRAVLGLTVSCARCHDHKYEPIPTTDYYALAGILCSTELCAGVRNKMGGSGLEYYDTALLLRLGPETKPDPTRPQRIAQAQAALAGARKELAALRDKPDKDTPAAERTKRLEVQRQRIDKLEGELFALTDPAAQGPVALGVREAAVIADTEIRIRGQAEQLGPAVPRGFLSAIDVPGAPKIAARQSGRLELARWLTDAQSPLAPRVMVNRVWQHLFGQGLVSSVDNFGVTGEPPSHPELLDYLATRFVRDGWSVKKLVRMLLLSRTYGLGTSATPAHLAADPANRLLWRHSPRRLDAEEIRDATLAVAGRLDLSRPLGSAAKDLKVVEMTDDGPVAQGLALAAAKCTHRSVYLPLVRGLTPRSLEVFDFAEQGLVTGRRDTTTVASQALYLLNDAFVRQQAEALAERILRETSLADAGRIGLAYRLTLGRPAAASEIDRASSYLADYQAAARDSPARAAWASFCQALLASAEFRYVR